MGGWIKVQGSKVGVMEYRDRGVKGKVEVSGVGTKEGFRFRVSSVRV
jgi:hypothetical protein